MTTTTSEREARKILDEFDRAIGWINNGGHSIAAGQFLWKHQAILREHIAALTREQREEVPASIAGLLNPEQVPIDIAAITAKHWMDYADAPQQEAPEAVCSPGEPAPPPSTPAQHYLANHNGCASQDWQDGFNVCARTTQPPPAPVDVRALRALANALRNEAGDWNVGSTRGALQSAANRIDALTREQREDDAKCDCGANADNRWPHHDECALNQPQPEAQGAVALSHAQLASFASKCGYTVEEAAGTIGLLNDAIAAIPPAPVPAEAPVAMAIVPKHSQMDAAVDAYLAEQEQGGSLHDCVFEACDAFVKAAPPAPMDVRVAELIATCAALTRREAQQETRKGALDELARENERLGLSYTDAPQQEAPGAVATVTGNLLGHEAEIFPAIRWDRSGPLPVGSRLYTTPPAPVDVRVAELIAAAKDVADEHMGALAANKYDGEDDEVGTRVCCGVVSYAEHEKDCPAIRLRAALALLDGQSAGVNANYHVRAHSDRALGEARWMVLNDPAGFMRYPANFDYRVTYTTTPQPRMP